MRKLSRRRCVSTLFFWLILALPFLFRQQMPGLFIRNDTESMPLGFYVILPDRPVKVGDIIAFTPPQELWQLAYDRGWTNGERYWLKEEAAVEGDTYTITDTGIYIIFWRRERNMQIPPISGNWKTGRILFSGGGCIWSSIWKM